MQFSEKQLGDLFVKNINLDEYLPSQQRKRLKLGMEMEKKTSYDGRADLVFFKEGRFLWVVEFKIVADPSAIKQAAEYYGQFIHDIGIYNNLSIGKISIAAQFIRDDAMFFAESLGVELIQIAPVNFSYAKINLILGSKPMGSKNRSDTDVLERSKGFLQIWDVVRG